MKLVDSKNAFDSSAVPSLPFQDFLDSNSKHQTPIGLQSLEPSAILQELSFHSMPLPEAGYKESVSQ